MVRQGCFDVHEAAARFQVLKSRGEEPLPWLPLEVMNGERGNNELESAKIRRVGDEFIKTQFHVGKIRSFSKALPCCLKHFCRAVHQGAFNRGTFTQQVVRKDTIAASKVADLYAIWLRDERAEKRAQDMEQVKPVRYVMICTL